MKSAHVALMALVVTLGFLSAAPVAEAGMKVGVRVCFVAIPLDCIGTCIDTPLSPPDFCETYYVPI